MKFTTVVAPLALLAGSAVATTESIVQGVTVVDLSTLKLKNYIDTWTGNLLGALPIVAESTSLLANINRGEKAAKASEEVDIYGALAIAEITTKLQGSVNGTMRSLIDAKPKFKKLGQGPIILLNLKLQKSATEDMSAAIVEKVPDYLRELAAGLTEPILADFDLALDEFALFQ